MAASRKAADKRRKSVKTYSQSRPAVNSRHRSARSHGPRRAALLARVDAMTAVPAHPSIRAHRVSEAVHSRRRPLPSGSRHRSLIGAAFFDARTSFVRVRARREDTHYLFSPRAGLRKRGQHGPKSSSEQRTKAA